MKTVRMLDTGYVLSERYQIESLLGNGRLGESYVCRDLIEGKSRVVLKILGDAKHREADAGLLYEELFIRRLRHPNLVRIMDFGIIERSGEPFLVKEYIEGTDLVSGTEGMDTDSVLNILIELTQAMHFMHMHGIIHGNIKPSNVFLSKSEDGRLGLKLMEFGFAGRLHVKQEDGELGALAYSAPEILMNERVNEKTDLYSLGILAYQVLARRLPFEDEDPGFLIQKQLQGIVDMRPIERLKGGSVLSQLVRGLLEKDKDKRIASTEFVVRLLCKAVGRDCLPMGEKKIEGQLAAARLVGREREMLALIERAACVRDGGRGWTVYITGEAGTGKTRCMEELKVWALLKGWRVVEGSCGVREEMSYGPYRQILSRTAPGKGEEIFRFGEIPRVADAGAFESFSEHAAGQFRDLLTREMVRRLAEKPTLLLMHDFQWADEATSAVLDYLSSDIQAHPILMIVSIRTGEELKGAIGRVMEQSIRQQRGEKLPLEPLKKENIGDLVAGMTGAPELKESLGSWIFQSIGGNPFYAEEMLKHLIEQGILVMLSNGWKFLKENLGNLETPAGVEMVLKRRLEQLSPPARELANWLALIHRPVPKSLLKLIVAESGLDVGLALQELHSRQMIRIEMNESEEIIEFQHSLISEVIRNNISTKHSRNLHSRIAHILEHACNSNKFVQEIAAHYIQAKYYNKAIEYSIKSGAECKNEYAYEGVLKFYGFVWEKGRNLTHEMRRNITIEIAESCCALGFSSRAIKLLRLELNQVYNYDSEIKANLMLHLAIAYRHHGNINEIENCANKALKYLRQNDTFNAHYLKAALLTHLAYCQLINSNPIRGLLILSKALDEMSVDDDNALVGQIYSLISALQRIACNLSIAIQAARTSIMILEPSKAYHKLAVSYSHLGACLLAYGRFGKSLEQHKHAVNISEYTRSIPLRAQALSNYAECLCRSGNLLESNNTSEAAVKLSIECGNPIIHFSCMATLAEIKLTLGDYKAANNILSELSNNVSLKYAIYSKAHVNYLWAWLNYEIGDYDAALSCINDVNKLEKRSAPIYERELGEIIRVRILYIQGHINDAFQLLNDLDRLTLKKRWPYQICFIKLCLGELLITEKKYTEAKSAIRSALRIANAMKSLLLLAQAHYLMGRLYSIIYYDNYDNIRTITKYEIQAAIDISNTYGFTEILWRSHHEMAKIEELLLNWDSCLHHTSEALLLLREYANRVPDNKVPLFWSVFQRNNIIIECENRRLNIIYKKTKMIGFSSVDVNDQERQIDALSRISCKISLYIEIDSILEIILEQLLQYISVSRAMIYLQNEMTGQYEYRKGKSINYELKKDDDGIVEDIIQTVSLQKTPFVSANAKCDIRLQNVKMEKVSKVGTIFCAPLKVSDRIIGIIYADHPESFDGIRESNISFFAAFCNIAAIAIDNALAHQIIMKEKSELEQYLHRAPEGYSELIGKSASLEALRDRIALVSASPLDVLIYGESGTGKELVSRAIFRTGRRKNGQFISVDCGSLSDSLAESELFGYRKGAFTGASDNRQGLIEAANGGILFLDEISNLPFILQAKLLRVLQEREVRRLGETASHKVDIQIIAATNKDLMEEINAGRFRKDLYYRLKAMEIRVPALRERIDDIPLLVEWFLLKTAEREGGKLKRFSSDAMEFMKGYSYPGNIRELKNIVENAYYSIAGYIIGINEIPQDIHQNIQLDNIPEKNKADIIYKNIVEGKGGFEELVKQPFSKRQFGSAVIKNIIQMALKETHGRYKDAFIHLGIPDKSYSVTIQYLKRNKCYLDYRPFRIDI